MLPFVETPVQKIDKYQGLISKNLLKEIKKRGEELKGLKVNFINSTPRGGGVAEILKSLVPLMKGIGIDARWYTLPLQKSFFKITKQIHNALQGENYEFPFSARKKYMDYMEKTAKLMYDMKADLWVVHDPQPAGIIPYIPHFHPSVCRLHIDLTSPNQEIWKFISGFLAMYDKIIVSSKRFIKIEIKRKAVVFPPAIDPLNPKNIKLSSIDAKHILKSYGINIKKPLISQVSRFDPFKDPLGVIESYKLAKKKIPDLQLALVGFFLAQDDPEAVKIYKAVEKKAKKDPDIFTFVNPEILGSLKVYVFVNAIQSASNIILQKSVKEGFGLTLAEAMWKERPVIGGNAEGIKLQLKDKENGFLVSNPKQAAERIVQLIQNPKLAKKLGEKAKKTVKQKFLMPRLLRDYLKLFQELT